MFKNYLLFINILLLIIYKFNETIIAIITLLCFVMYFLLNYLLYVYLCLSFKKGINTIIENNYKNTII